MGEVDIDVAAQCRFLVEEGCHRDLGYSFAKPGPLAKLAGAVQASNIIASENQLNASCRNAVRYA